ncbi:hypothetical protein [Bhargavaea cecembensis]|uniref:hypothetical protein n=1 Tax=Bhargavaea cecembensis TaxID=394098 RepID=UPI0005915EDE|nr:hypothetical protein [Bhargavaea cecembensis]
MFRKRKKIENDLHKVRMERRQALEPHRTGLERFIHQDGEPAGKVRETAESILREAAEKDEAGRAVLYQIFCIRTGERAAVDESEVFRFPEDEFLHWSITGLPADERRALLLLDFHGFGAEEAGEILGCSPEEALQKREKAAGMLAESDGIDHLRSRESLLKKAYERISFPAPEAAETPEDPPVAEPARSRSRRTWPVFAAGAVALLLIAATFYLSSRTGPVDEAYLEQLKERYDGEVEAFRVKAGVKKEGLTGLFTLEEANRRFSDLRLKEEHDLLKGEPADRRKVEKDYQEIVHYLDFPSELASRLKRNSLTEDFNKSWELYELFNMRRWELGGSVMDRIDEYPEYFQKAVREGEFDEKRFYASSADYPERLRNTAAMMKSEGYELGVMKADGQEILTIIRFPSLLEESGQLHPSVAGYVRMMEKMTAAELGTADYPLQEMAADLGELERLSALENESSPGGYETRSLAVHLFSELIFGSGGNQVFGPDGTVEPARREAWRTLVALGDESPAARLIGPVVSEMEASGWRKSAAYNRLGNTGYLDLLAGVREGNYEDTGGFQPQSVYLPENPFEARAEMLYEEIQSADDQTILADESPVMIAVLYGMAVHQQDENMMQKLTGGRVPSEAGEKAAQLIAGGIGGGDVTVTFSPQEVETSDTGIHASVTVMNDHDGGVYKLWLDYSASGVWTVDPTSPD